MNRSMASEHPLSSSKVVFSKWLAVLGLMHISYQQKTLGANCAFLSSDLGIPEAEISDLARWNHCKNPRVSLVALRSRRTDSLLRGVILAAAGSSVCYRQFAVHRYGRPYRDFYYNVTYESIAYVCRQWGARRLAVSHLSGSEAFHEDIATCNAEALAHYCDSTPMAKVESFLFLGCCISMEHLRAIARLNSEGSTGHHRAISTDLQHRKGFDLIDLAWEGKATQARHATSVE